MLKKIVCLALPGMAPFEFGVICEVFGIDRTRQGGPVFDFHIVAAEPGPIPHEARLRHRSMHEDLCAAADADLIAVPAYSSTAAVHPEVLRVLREAEDRGAWVLSVCSGAFVLGEAGLLDGTPRHDALDARRQARRASIRSTEVDPDVLFVEDRKRRHRRRHRGRHRRRAAHRAQGARRRRRERRSPAAWSCRRSATAASRSTSQHAASPSAAATRSRGVTDWMLENLDQDLTVDQLARKALMSSRTFARRFRAELGHDPGGLAEPAAAAARAAAARGDRPRARGRSPPRPASARPPSCGTTS